MKLSTHMIAQVGATALQYLNLASGVVPAKGQPYVALAIGIVQAVLAFVNHNPAVAK
jgi:hypothetical protein